MVRMHSEVDLFFPSNLPTFKKVSYVDFQGFHNSGRSAGTYFGHLGKPIKPMRIVEH